MGAGSDRDKYIAGGSWYIYTKNELSPFVKCTGHVTVKEKKHGLDGKFFVVS